MAGESIDLDTYNDTLATIINKAVDEASTGGAPSTYTRQADRTALNSAISLIASYSASNKLPATYSAFIAALSSNSGQSSSYFEDALEEAYYAAVLPGSDGDTLAAALGITVTELKARLSTQFAALYATFASNFNYTTFSAASGNSAKLVEFINQLHSYYNTNVAVISSSSSPLTYYNASGSKSVILPSYQQIYEAFFPPTSSSTTTFTAFLKQFYNDQMDSNDYFNPSQNYVAFVSAVQEAAKADPTIYAASSVTTDQSGRPAVMNRIFELIVQMISVLQSVAAAQSDRLTIYAQWTKAYTDAMNQLPTFSAYDPKSPISNKAATGSGLPDYGSDDDRAKTRSELNDKVVAPITERLRSYRDNVTNDSKSLQSTVNQTNDAVSQQTNLATAILQELSTLLSAIFR